MRLVGRIRVLSKDQWLLPGTNNLYKHLATITDGLREFICFQNTYNLTCYIEEITGGHLSLIEDQELWEEIVNHLQEQNILKIEGQT